MLVLKHFLSEFIILSQTYWFYEKAHNRAHVVCMPPGLQAIN